MDPIKKFHGGPTGGALSLRRAPLLLVSPRPLSLSLIFFSKCTKPVQGREIEWRESQRAPLVISPDMGLTWQRGWVWVGDILPELT